MAKVVEFRGNKEPSNDFYFSANKEIVMAQNFNNVRIYIYYDGKKKWSDTNIVGSLRLVQIAQT